MDKIITSTPCSEGTLAAAIGRYEKNPRNIELCRFLHREYTLRGMTQEARNLERWIKTLEDEMHSPKIYCGLEVKHWGVILGAVLFFLMCLAAGEKNPNGINPASHLLGLAMLAAAGFFPLIWAIIRKSGSKVVVGIINGLSLFGALHVIAYAASANKKFLLYETNINNLIFGVLVFWVTALILAEVTKSQEK